MEMAQLEFDNTLWDATHMIRDVADQMRAILF